MADERDNAAEAAAEEAKQPESAPEAAPQAPQAPQRPTGAPGRPEGRRPAPPRGAQGRVYIKATFNNTIISITDQRGNVIAWASGGTAGFKGTRKGTPFAAQLAAESVARRAIDAGIRRLEVFTRGPGSGRETAVRAMQAVGMEIGAIKDMTPRPHNGCRPKKRRRM